MTKNTTKIDEIKSHFESKDYDLGYRKLLDCVLDTNDIQLFKSVIKIENWKELYPDKLTETHEMYQGLVDLIEDYEINYTEPKVILSAKNISKSYGRAKFGLSDVSLDLNTGEIIGLVGENGNGKTTLLRIFAKELSYDSGEINFNLSQKFKSNFDLRTKLVYIPQRTPKWYGSLLNNLKYCASSYGIQGEMNQYLVEMMIIRFGLWKYRHLKWSELSSGYKMRFELARTFLRAPEVLFLDEPLANLDVVAQQLVLEDLKNMARSHSRPIGIILSSQQLFEVEKIADSVLFLKNGKPQLNASNEHNLTENKWIEFETPNSRTDVDKALKDFKLIQSKFNGGMYTVEFDAQVEGSAVLQAMITNQIKINYYRDISKSTKRLFV